MRFLLINQFYPPDLAPTGVFLHDVAKGLVKAGHDVTVLCSRAGYDGKGVFAASEMREGVAIRRVGGIPFERGSASRLASYVSFMTFAFPRLQMGKKPDVVLTLTSPPYVGLLGAQLVQKRHVRHVHWAMDIYPDVLEAHGQWGFVRRKLEGLSRWQMARTHLVIAPAEGMAKRLKGRVGPGTSVEMVPLWTRDRPDETADVPALRERLGWPKARVILLYSGNMGLGHRFEEFLAGARSLGPQGPLWLFAGSGPRRDEIARASGVEGVARLLPYAEPEEHRSRSLAADVHLISLCSSWDGLIVPSKLQAAFGIGRPVIFVGARAGEPGRWVEESGGGWIVPEGDLPSLYRAVAEATDRAERTRRGQAALEYARRRFDRDRNVARMVELLEAR